MSIYNIKNPNNWPKIAILGLGLDNRALLSLLASYKMQAQITIFDDRPKKDLPIIKLPYLKINYQLGATAHNNLNEFCIIFRSPGWPLSDPKLKKAAAAGAEVSSALDLFFLLCPSKNIIGVTGTKGKGTTATLIYKILKDAGRRVFLGGNIGVAPLSFLKKIRPNDYIVLELSSFQLEDLKFSPRIAVITNLYPEHLAAADPNNPNFHHSYNDYWQAKLNIAKNKQNKYLIANQTLRSKIKSSKLDKKIIYFTASSLPSRLVGDFNQENISAAVAVAKILKIKPTLYKKTITNFANLEHRLEFVAKCDGVKYFDNSFSTTPESTILDLKSFRSPLVLIAGGADKGADFKTLARTIKNKVKFLVLLEGRATPRIKKELLKIKFSKNKLTETDSMAKAVSLARSKSAAGEVILLSTACASFGLFKNYKERGDLFKKYAKLGK